MKNTAKTLTLTAKKAPAKTATAQLAVPKTATSYFLETEAAAKVTVVKTRSRLASLKAQAEAVANEAVTAEPAAATPQAVEAAPAAVEAAPVAAEAAPVVQAPAPAPVAAAPAAAEPAETQPSDEQPYFVAPATPAVAPVIVRKRTSKLAALKAAEAPAPAPVAAPAAAPAPVAEEAPKVVRTRTRRLGLGLQRGQTRTGLDHRHLGRRFRFEEVGGRGFRHGQLRRGGLGRRLFRCQCQGLGGVLHKKTLLSRRMRACEVNNSPWPGPGRGKGNGNGPN